MVDVLDHLAESRWVKIFNLYCKDEYPNLKIYRNNEKTMNKLFKDKTPWEIMSLTYTSCGYYMTMDKWVMQNVVLDTLSSNDNPRRLAPDYCMDMKRIAMLYSEGKVSEQLKKELDTYLKGKL